jgi:hypothetical protein
MSVDKSTELMEREREREWSSVLQEWWFGK